jgi:hypothetical protein
VSFPGSTEWLDEHGILERVWNERPYVRYSPGNAAKTAGGSWVASASGLQRVLDEYAGLEDEQIKFAVKVANGGENPYRDEHLETMDGGFLIMRKSPPGLEHHGKAYAELRPDNAVATRRRWWEYHGPRPYPAHIAVDSKTGLPCKPKKDGGGPIGRTHLHTAEAMAAHITRQKFEDDHFPGDPRLDEVHWHQDVAKYCFMRGAYVTQRVQRKDGTWFERQEKDESESIARRLDMHDLAFERFERDPATIYFALEGCLKADAILSEIIRLDLDATVVSVPSVTLWRAQELDEFIELYLLRRRVVIVCDSDATRNPLVRTQGLLLRSFLLNRGVASAEIVTPEYPGSEDPSFLQRNPVPEAVAQKMFWKPFDGGRWAVDVTKLDKKGKPLLNGVDDLIGDAWKKNPNRKPLDELKRLGNQVSENVLQWVRDHPRKTMGKDYRADANDAIALEGMLAHASPPTGDFPHWTYWGSAETLATVLDYDEPPQSPARVVHYKKPDPARLPAWVRRTQRSLRSLVDRWALELLAGSDEIQQKRVRTKGGWRLTGFDFFDRPRYRIVAEELEPRELSRRSLAELPEADYYNRAADLLQGRANGDVKSVAIGKERMQTTDLVDERLSRIELREQMHGEALDDIRSTVHLLAERLEDEGFAEAARRLGFID